MAGLRPESPRPSAITLHQGTQRLEVVFDDGFAVALPAELLRVYSPSAEVQGHSPDQAVLQVGKRHVKILGLEPVGHYALRPTFSDGHDSGLYTWDYLYHLGRNEARLWAEYEAKLAAAGGSRDPEGVAT
jgi:DUF971 family protein